MPDNKVRCSMRSVTRPAGARWLAGRPDDVAGPGIAGLGRSHHGACDGRRDGRAGQLRQFAYRRVAAAHELPVRVVVGVLPRRTSPSKNGVRTPGRIDLRPYPRTAPPAQPQSESASNPDLTMWYAPGRTDHAARDAPDVDDDCPRHGPASPAAPLATAGWQRHALRNRGPTSRARRLLSTARSGIPALFTRVSTAPCSASISATRRSRRLIGDVTSDRACRPAGPEDLERASGCAGYTRWPLCNQCAVAGRYRSSRP